jgi:hypothetical protein
MPLRLAVARSVRRAVRRRPQRPGAQARCRLGGHKLNIALRLASASLSANELQV